MFQRTRHFAPTFRTWDPVDARKAIMEIATDAMSHVDATTLWPSHPMDDGVLDGLGSVYFGGGIVWALNYPSRVHVITDELDLAPLVTAALERNAPWFATTAHSRHAPLLVGKLGILMVQMRVAPDQGLADAIYALLASNSELPIVELMWGLPGCMLACIHMHTMTNDHRFIKLFELQAARLLEDLEMDENGPIWTQHLYGRRQRWLGPVHGFAGNMLPLLHGWDWLTPKQRAVVADGVLVLSALMPSLRTRGRIGLPLCRAISRQLSANIATAPQAVTTFADAPFSTPAFEALLVRGGELTWTAGPVVKGSNLCPGTGGNGYAFLKLHKRTGDPVWLERAQSFAMAAIDQVRALVLPSAGGATHSGRGM